MNREQLAVGFSINDIKAMISKNGMSKDDQTRIIKEKISEIEEVQKKLEDSKENLYDILEWILHVRMGSENINLKDT
ncbi:MerR family DNA-binding protein [Paenibacillus sp. NPDC093718]|uniref:MerR family DNA-binding protein n=1 Tax=Paenibacillus sp. NPDC093718 TaxID=3390601 RepID=UPI003D069B59